MEIMFNIKQGEKNDVKCCESKQLEVFTWLAQRERKEDKGTGTIRKHKREKLELFIEQISILYVQDCGGIAERKCLKINDINTTWSHFLISKHKQKVKSGSK